MTVDSVEIADVSEAAHQTLNFLCELKLKGFRVIQTVKADVRPPTIYQMFGDMRGCFRIRAESSPFPSVDLHKVGSIQRQRLESGH